jgi:hypothetical protein
MRLRVFVTLESDLFSGGVAHFYFENYREAAQFLEAKKEEGFSGWIGEKYPVASSSRSVSGGDAR